MVRCRKQVGYYYDYNGLHYVGRNGEQKLLNKVIGGMIFKYNELSTEYNMAALGVFEALGFKEDVKDVFIWK